MNNRIYKFRAWDNNKKKIIHFPLSMMKNFIGWELMQYTGLTDKHGKEIYEGDIVEYDKGFQNKPFYNLFKLEIGFSRGSFLLLDPEDKGSYRGGFSAFYLHTPCLTVIGNVFENPNLLQANSKKDE